jgi:hypothetical protein
LTQKQKTIISGREASILSLIVQTKYFSVKERKRILSALNGRALQIAEVLLGQAKHSKKIRRIAEGFVKWANELQKI